MTDARQMQVVVDTIFRQCSSATGDGTLPEALVEPLVELEKCVSLSTLIARVDTR